MNMTVCRKCDNRCHLFKEMSGKWTLITNRMVQHQNIPQPSSHPTMWLRHAENDSWRYAGGSEVRDKNGVLKICKSKVPKDVLEQIELSKDCEYYVENLMEEWNR